MSQRQIAERLGVSRRTVRDDLEKEMATVKEETQKHAKEYIEFQVARLEQIIFEHLPIAIDLDDDRFPQSAAIVDRAEGKLMKLLGTEAATRIEQTTKTEGKSAGV